MSFASKLRRGAPIEGPIEPEMSNQSAGDCVAFVNDPETHGIINIVCGPRFPGLQIVNGGTREVVDYLAAGAPPKLLIVDVSDSAKPMSAMLPIIAAFAEDTKVIAIGAVNDINLYREMTEAGISDYLVKPVSDRALDGAINRAEERRQQAMQASMGAGPAAAATTDKRWVVSVLGTRGGVGATTVATNLAWLMAFDKKRDTILMDLDLQDGSIALALDVEPSHGLREVLDNPSRIDSLFITSVGVKCGDHLTVMAAEEGVDDEVHYNTSAVSLLVEELRKQSPVVVVDVPRKAAAARAAVLAASTDIIVVTDMTLAGLRDAIRFNAMIQQVASSARVIFVANRDGGKEATVSKTEFEKALGKQVNVVLADDPKANQAAANAGKPVVAAAASSKMTAGFKSVASLLMTDAASGKPAKKKFSFFSKKK
ncbi:MAG: CpaE family protein [Dongiaceae bacterium]